MGIYDRDWYRAPRHVAGGWLPRGRPSGRPSTGSGSDRVNESWAVAVVTIGLAGLLAALLFLFVLANSCSRGHV